MRRRFEDVDIGEEIGVYRPEMGLESVCRFAHATGMKFGRFTNHEAARQEGLPGAIVPGIMSQGILVAVIHRWAPGCHVEKIDTIFRAPVLVDAPAICRGVVTQKNDTERTVEIDLTITNEAEETRVLGMAVVRLDRDPGERPSPRI